MTSTASLEHAARTRVDAVLGLAVHVLAYLAVNAGIAVAQGLDLGRGVVWGWGIGVAAHAAFVLGSSPRWRERMVEREITRRRA